MGVRTGHGDEAARAHAAEARRRFEAGEFGAAREGFERAFAAGDDSAETVAALHALYAEAGDQGAVVRLLDAYLARAGEALPAAEAAAWTAALFDAVVVDAGAEGRIEAALRLLDAVAAAGGAAWSLALEPGRRERIEAAFDSPQATLELLEQESFAPAETGLPAGAVARAEEIGRRHAAEPAVARAAERLLHALGERDAAYRVEAPRRQARDAAGRHGDEPAWGRADAAPVDLSGLVVAVAGGHPALRAMVRADLARSGVAAVREIPSRWEATRGGRAVHDQVAGADIAVLIGRRLAHSTSDQVRVAASRAGVPVVVAATAGVAAVRRAVEQWLSVKG